MVIVNCEENIVLEYGSSTHHPEAERKGITTCDFRLWIKFRDNWFKPYYNDFNMVFQLVNDCKNKTELEHVIYNTLQKAK